MDFVRKHWLAIGAIALVGVALYEWRSGGVMGKAAYRSLTPPASYFKSLPPGQLTTGPEQMAIGPEQAY